MNQVEIRGGSGVMQPLTFGMPFGRGEVADLAALLASGFGVETQWRPLAWWPDGSILAALAEVPAGTAGTLTWSPAGQVPAIGSPGFPWDDKVQDLFEQGWILSFEAEDVRGGRYRAAIDAQACTQARLIEIGPLRATWEFSGDLFPANALAMGRPFLRFHAWVTVRRETPAIWLDCWLGNTMLSDKDPQGIGIANAPVGHVFLAGAEVRWVHPGTTATLQVWGLKLLDPSRVLETGPSSILDILPKGNLWPVADATLLHHRCALDLGGIGPALVEGWPAGRVDLDRWQLLWPEIRPAAATFDYAADAATDLAKSDQAAASQDRWGDLGVDPVKDPSQSGSPRMRLLPKWAVNFIVSGEPAYLELLRRWVQVQTCRTYHYEGFRSSDHPNTSFWMGAPVTSYTPSDMLGRKKLTTYDWLRNGSTNNTAFTRGWKGWSAEHLQVSELAFHYLFTGDDFSRDELSLIVHEVGSAPHFRMPKAGEQLGTTVPWLKYTRPRGWLLHAATMATLLTKDPEHLETLAHTLQATDLGRNKWTANPDDPDGSKKYAVRFYRAGQPSDSPYLLSTTDRTFQLAACVLGADFARRMLGIPLAQAMELDFAACISLFAFDAKKGLSYDVIGQVVTPPGDVMFVSTNPKVQNAGGWGGGTKLFSLDALAKAAGAFQDPRILAAAKALLGTYQGDPKMNPKDGDWGWFAAALSLP